MGGGFIADKTSRQNKAEQMSTQHGQSDLQREVLKVLDISSVIVAQNFESRTFSVQSDT